VRAGLVLLAATVAGSTPAPPQEVDRSGLPIISPAPDFMLQAQDGTEVTLGRFRGKVVALTFIFVSCSATCPILIAKMTTVQDRLADDFGSKFVFLSITVDPEHDSPDVLKHYAEAVGADPRGWKFLTGSPEAIHKIENRYGLFAAKTDKGMDHTNLTSLIDPHGMLRVQYLGVRFNPDEFHRDLLSLVERP
jgi:protein SCO1/2